MTSVLELMQQGFPSRAQFAELYALYRTVLPPELARLDPRLFCKALFKALGLNEADFKFGMTKVFFRPGKFAEFDQLMRSDPENLRVLVGRVKRWLVRSRWRKAQWCAWSVVKLTRKIAYRRAALVTIQSAARMYLAKKRHRPRIRALVNIKSLSGQVAQIAAMAASLKMADKEAVLFTARRLEGNIATAVGQVKGGRVTQKAELDRLYQSLVDQIRTEVAGVKAKIEQQKAVEEAAKLRKLQEEMERARHAREAEAAEVRRLEEEHQARVEMEARRRVEEERARELEEQDKVTAESLQKQLDTANARLAEQREQERRDHELALRLAIETGGSVEELQLKRSSLVTAQREAAAAKKYNLAKWKYAELRDTINTSCDIELLEACR